MIVLDSATLLDTLVAFMLLSVRISAMLLAAPLFSASSVSIPIRVITALAIAVMLLQAVPTPKVDILSPAGALALAGEAIVGAAIGFLFQLGFAAVQLAGEQIAASTGLGFAAMLDPQTGTQSPVINQFLSIMMLLSFLTLEGHHILLKLLAASYQALPIGTAFFNAPVLIGIAKAGALIFSAGMLACLPIIVALFLVTLVIGILTRVAPQMNLFSVGFAISILAGLALMLVALPGLTASMAGILDETANRARTLILNTGGGA